MRRAACLRVSSVTNSGSSLNYSYHSAGNVTNDGVQSYTYDAENRIVSVDRGATASYAYDHQNRRITKVVGSTTTHYVWEGYQVIAEHNGSTGAVVTEYIFAGSRMIAREQSGRVFFLSDRLSIRATISDGQGGIQGRQATLPFGEDFAESGTQDKHHLTSYERDAESGSDYAVNRQYSQSVARFTRVDPVDGSTSSPQTLNRYSYTGNDPINATDPVGRCTTIFLWTPIINGDPGIPQLALVICAPGLTINPPAARGGAGAADPGKKAGKKRKKQYKDFFDSDANQRCREKLEQAYGKKKLEKIRNAIDDVKFYDTDMMANEDAINWIPGLIAYLTLSDPANRNKYLNAKLPDVFKPNFNAQIGQIFAATVPPNMRNEGRHPGIFTPGGIDGSYFSGEKGDNNLFHGLTHFVTGVSDQDLTSKFNIPNGDTNKWFQDGCPP